MSDEPDRGEGAEEAQQPRAHPLRRIGEDWAATATGLALLLLSLAGAIPAGIVP
ncbi:hypothetical protein [Nocardiopsis composta]|uniref:Uncharacterized protein n=1 Tax=Nocardiopsis composta TaxID=157465 RepID=A0A7W8QGK9_9ACTN|nr:hypothetical protein [Nocardiopsis composta]MBB5430063.1 hypothetical protein [Nocardiopsis composta]